MITKREYYEVLYTHKSGSIGVMGNKHATIEDAIAHINYLKNDKDKCYSADRTYYINHVIETRFCEKMDIKLP